MKTCIKLFILWLSLNIAHTQYIGLENITSCSATQCTVMASFETTLKVGTNSIKINGEKNIEIPITVYNATTSIVSPNQYFAMDLGTDIIQQSSCQASLLAEQTCGTLSGQAFNPQSYRAYVSKGKLTLDTNTNDCSPYHDPNFPQGGATGYSYYCIGFWGYPISVPYLVIPTALKGQSTASFVMKDSLWPAPAIAPYKFTSGTSLNIGTDVQLPPGVTITDSALIETLAIVDDDDPIFNQSCLLIGQTTSSVLPSSQCNVKGGSDPTKLGALQESSSSALLFPNPETWLTITSSTGNELTYDNRIQIPTFDSLSPTLKNPNIFTTTKSSGSPNEDPIVVQIPSISYTSGGSTTNVGPATGPQPSAPKVPIVTNAGPDTLDCTTGPCFTNSYRANFFTYGSNFYAIKYGQLFQISPPPAYSTIYKNDKMQFKVKISLPLAGLIQLSLTDGLPSIQNVQYMGNRLFVIHLVASNFPTGQTSAKCAVGLSNNTQYTMYTLTSTPTTLKITSPRKPGLFTVRCLNNGKSVNLATYVSSSSDWNNGQSGQNGGSNGGSGNSNTNTSNNITNWQDYWIAYNERTCKASCIPILIWFRTLVWEEVVNSILMIVWIGLLFYTPSNNIRLWTNARFLTWPSFSTKRTSKPEKEGVLMGFVYVTWLIGMWLYPFISFIWLSVGQMTLFCGGNEIAERKWLEKFIKGLDGKAGEQLLADQDNI